MVSVSLPGRCQTTLPLEIAREPPRAVSNRVRAFGIAHSLCPGGFRHAEGMGILHQNNRVVIGNRVIFHKDATHPGDKVRQTEKTRVHIGGVAAIIHQRARSVFLRVIEPAPEIFGAADLFRAIMRRAVLDISDGADVPREDAPLPFLKLSIPSGRPVDEQACLCFGGGFEHSIRLGQRRRHRFFH